jgi:hypothetical protein
LAGVQSVGLSSLRIHQEGGVVEAHDPEEDGEEARHRLVIEWSACSRNQGAPWESG